MSTNKKEIILTGHGPSFCHNGRDFSVAWEDVWVKFKNHRKVVKLAPCILRAGFIDEEIEREREFLSRMREQQAAGTLDRSWPVVDNEGNEVDRFEFPEPEEDAYEEENWESLQGLIEVRDYFKNNSGEEFFILPPDPEYASREDEILPNIYVNRKTLNRKDFEDCLSWWLKHKKHISNGVDLKFVWKVTDFVVMPHGYYTEEECK